MRVIFVTVLVLSTFGARAAQSNLPARVRAYLDTNYSGWKLSAVESGCPRDFKRSLVIGDFDGDRKRDYTVKSMSGQKGYIVAFLSRGTDYNPYVLEDGSASEMRSQGLSVARKGETYPEIVNDNFDRVTRRLQHDAPVGGTCESSAYLYIYRNGTFRRAFVSD
jgi:hypothetical protein